MNLENTPPLITMISKEYTLVKNRDVFEKLRFSDILYLKADGKYVDIFIASNKYYSIRSSLTKLLNKFPKTIVQVHRAYCVNIEKIEVINTSEQFISLKESNVTIPLGRTFKAILLDKFEIF